MPDSKLTMSDPQTVIAYPASRNAGTPLDDLILV